MKKVWIAVLFVLLMASAVSCAYCEEDILAIHSDLDVALGERFMDLSDEEDCVLCDLQETEIYCLMPLTEKEMGITADSFRILADQEWENSKNAFGEFFAAPREVNGFLIFSCMTEMEGQEMVFYIAVGEKIFVYIYPMLADGTAVDGLVEAFYEKNIEKKTETVKLAEIEITPELIAGYYDFYANGVETYDKVNMIITPKGHVRLINNTSSKTFDLQIKDNQIIPEHEEIKLQLLENGLMQLSIEGIELVFQKRPDIAEETGLPGEWKLTGMETDTMKYNRVQLALQGISCQMIVYPSGAVDWHAVTNSVSDVAQGWGVDEKGIYLNNGDSIGYFTLSGDRLEYRAQNGFRTILYIFERIQ